MEPTRIIPKEDGTFSCPKCGANMNFMERQPVKVIDGKLVMEEAEEHYLCKACNSIYRRIVSTDYYQWYKGPAKSVKDLDPVKLVQGQDGNCRCPICLEILKFIEGQPVKVVNGKVNMADAEDHYRCEKCKATYRRLVNTDYYQWHNE